MHKNSPIIKKGNNIHKENKNIDKTQNPKSKNTTILPSNGQKFPAQNS